MIKLIWHLEHRGQIQRHSQFFADSVRQSSFFRAGTDPTHYSRLCAGLLRRKGGGGSPHQHRQQPSATSSRARGGLEGLAEGPLADTTTPLPGPAGQCAPSGSALQEAGGCPSRAQRNMWEETGSQQEGKSVAAKREQQQRVLWKAGLWFQPQTCPFLERGLSKYKASMLLEGVSQNVCEPCTLLREKGC